MRNTRLEAYAKKNGLEVYPEQLINGSLVDYHLRNREKSIFVLIRESPKEEDLLYLSGVGNRWDNRFMLVSELPNQVYFENAQKINVPIYQINDLESIDMLCRKNNEILQPTHLDELSKLSWGGRSLVMATAFWRESVLLFVVGFLAAVVFNEALAPYVNEVIQTFIGSLEF